MSQPKYTQLKPAQKIGLNALNNTKNRNGTLDMIMRSGKAGIGLNYIHKTKPKKVLWIAFDTDERDLKLKEEASFWGFDYMFDNEIIDTVLPHSLHTIKWKYDLIIYNECHTLSSKRLKELKRILSSNPDARFIGMTGTYPQKRDKIKMFEQIGLDNILCKYTDEDGVEDESISDYHITVYEVPLDTRANVKVNYTNKFTGEEKYFYRSEVEQIGYQQNIINRVDQEARPYEIERERIQEQINQFEEYSEESRENKAILRDLYGKNKNLVSILKPIWNKKKIPSMFLSKALNKLESKVQVARSILYKYSGVDNCLHERRTLIFAQDTEHAEKISKSVYHSKSERTWLDRFESEDVSHLVLVNKAATGYSYDNVYGCILLNVNSSNTEVLQKIFRTVKFRKDHVANIIILITKDTIQKKWLTKALTEIPNEKITFKDWNEYNF